jgi:hypothetical protein
VPPDGQRIIDAVANDVPDGAIIVAPWYEASALGYGASVEHALGSRIIVAGWPGEHARSYIAWSRMRPVIVYAGGFELMSAAGIPREYFQELASSNPFYRVLKFVPISTTKDCSPDRTPRLQTGTGWCSSHPQDRSANETGH